MPEIVSVLMLLPVTRMLTHEYARTGHLHWPASYMQQISTLHATVNGTFRCDGDVLWTKILRNMRAVHESKLCEE
jgi:hypothetical protein